MMSKNAYAKRLNATKHQMERDRARYIIQTEYDLMTIMLNREFGFGRDRIIKAQEALNSLHAEFADEVFSTDGDYAHGVLKRAVAQIMGDGT